MLTPFTHLVRMQADGVKSGHKLLCNPKISALLKAVHKGFLKGCPNLNKKLILTYLNPSPAMAKGHMERPRHRISITRPKLTLPTALQIPVVPQPVLVSVRVPPPTGEQPHKVRARHNSEPNFIKDGCDESITNVFCFGAFADRHSGIVYNDWMGDIPFMSFNGSVCFLVLYNYEANAILATPIAGLDDVSIFKAYNENFGNLIKKGFKPKLKVWCTHTWVTKLHH